jgi:eukaryotic-like serine/threonine-protein kinase
MRAAWSGVVFRWAAQLPLNRLRRSRMGYTVRFDTMPLSVRDRLGPYEILAHLGAGGMGEVWKARDTRLNRTVAIKIAAEQFNERFEREAHAVAALNHPNICQIFDIGPDYIVLEYIEGERIAPPASLRKLLDLAVQMADGMSAAHAAGFVHRDLKPANILVTTDGRVKILDFGLAKSVVKSAQSDATQALTITSPGTVTGTAAYMSPEQAKGSMDLDSRSDEFAFGVILYELATGKNPFLRATAPETLTAIIREDAEPLPASVPAPFRWIVERCLAKEAKDRYESSRDLYLELRTLRDHFRDASSSQTFAAVAAPEEAAPALAQRDSKRKTWRIALACFCAGAALTAATLFLLIRRGTQNVSALRFTPFSFEEGGQGAPVWSPDGKAVAFSAAQSKKVPDQIYVRYLDSPVATQITHLPLYAFPIEWTRAGRIVFYSLQPPAGLWSVSAVGGEPEPLLAIGDLGEGRNSSVSADGSAIAVPHKPDGGLFGVWIGSPPGAPLKLYQPAPFAALTIINQPRLNFSPDGKQIMLIRNAGKGEEAWLMPYPADASHPPHRILQKLPAFGGTPQFSWMADNRHVVVSTSAEVGAPFQLLMADTVSGEFHELSGGTTDQMYPAVSPDGSKLVFADVANDFDTVSLDLAKATVEPLIATERSEQMPAWASKQPVLAYVTDRNGPLEIWTHQQGQNDRPVVTARDFPPDTTQWFMNPTPSPDATRVIYTRIERGGAEHLWMSAMSGGTPVRVVKNDAEEDIAGSWSPDGLWFVFLSIEGATTSLKKVKTNGLADPETLVAKLQPLPAPYGDSLPVWSPKGDWILYIDGAMKLAAPDGKTSPRDLGPGLKDAICTFSGDGALLYCVRQTKPREGVWQLFSVNAEGKGEHMIGDLPADGVPSSYFSPSLRLSLSPDGKSVTFATYKYSANLWLIDGLGGKRRGN